MNKELATLLDVVPENDNNYHLKLAEVARWYKVYGQKMFYHIDKESIDKVINVLNILMIDNRFWNHNIRLNNLILGKELIKRINIEQIDHSHLTTQLYDFACFLCSEEHIRELFFRSDNYNESWTTEKFVSDILNGNGEGPLIKFWSHYINIVGIENPNPVIFSSFKELLSKYSEDFDIDNINDIWKCGFECSKEQGSREALEFFWSKIKHQYEEKEREDILVNVGINAYSLCCFNRENNFNLIEFSLDHLGSAKYKYFVEESCKFENYFGTIFSLIDNYLYNEAKELISVLDFNVIDCERYGNSLICGTLQKVHNAPYKLKKQSFDFFSWIWTFEQLEEHRRYCLSDLYYIFDALKDSDELEVLVDPLKLVLNSASPEQIKRGFLTYPGSSICSTLYIKDERALLQNEVLKFFQDGDKFIDYVDNLVLNTLTECEELKGLDINEIFNFYRQGKTREFMESIEERVDNSQWFFYWLKEVTGDAFCKMIEGKVKFEQSVPSCIGGVRCDSLVSGISR